MADNSKKLIEAFRAKDLHTGLALFKKMMAERLEAAMAVERKTTYINEDYNGWKNRETWNVALWIGNDQGLYNLGRECAREEDPYEAFKERVGTEATGDRVRWDDPAVDEDEINDMLRELIAESVNEDAKVSKDEQGRPVYNNLKDGIKKLAKEEAPKPKSAFPDGMTKDAKDCEACKKLGHACPRHREVPKL